MTARVTLKSMAAQLGIHASLISRILRRDADVRVSSQTRARVLELAHRLDYRPDPMGRALRTRRTQLLGLLIPDITNPFYSVLFQAVEAAAMARGYTVLLANAGDSLARLAGLLDALCRGHVDGLLVAAAREGDECARQLAAAGVKHVLLNRRCNSSDLPWVGPDDRQAGELAANHLLALGHRRIAYVGGDNGIINMRLRQAGFRECLQAHHVLMPGQLSATDVLSRAEARLHTQAMLSLPEEQRPTALVVSNSVLPDGVLAAIRDAGLLVPRDISLVGYSPFEEHYLSSIAVPVQDIARIGTEWLIDQLAGHATPERLWRVLPVAFVDRGTTAPPQSRSGEQPRHPAIRQRGIP